MSLQEVTTYIAAFGIGGIIGVIIKSFSDSKIQKQKLLFEARTKAYAGITGRLFNIFLEPDITSLRDEALIWAKLNMLLSETFLLGSNELVELIGDYKTKVFEFHKKLEQKKDEDGIQKLHKELVSLAGEIFDQMRKDISVSRKTVWTKK